MIHINPYLNFKGNAEQAFSFYKSVFGGEYTMLQRFKETDKEGRLSAEEGEKIMHIALPIGKNIVLMATDALESMGQNLVLGNNFYLSLHIDSESEATLIFNSLSQGGEIEMPLQKTFWGAYFGMLKDKFGIQWMVTHDQVPSAD